MKKYQIKDGNIAEVLKNLPFGEGGEVVEMTNDEYRSYIESQKPPKTNLQKRLEEYGTPQEQLEYIVEHGLEAFVEKQNLIKNKYPKE